MARLNKIFRSVAVAVLAAAACACMSDYDFESEFVVSGSPNRGTSMGGREVNQDGRNVLLLYSAGFNNISSYLEADIEELKSGWLPGKNRTDGVLLVYSHKLARRGIYSHKNSPVLFRLSKDMSGNIVSDTLKVYDVDTSSVSATHLGDVLSYVKEEFPAKSYGMIFSSHATGYLPEGFYNNSGKYQYGDGSIVLLGHSDPFVDPYAHLVKSIGQHETVSSSREMELADFARAIPFKMDYILFDACLMGGVEVAYELKDKCDLVGFSPAEVLVDGLDYTKLTTHLLKDETPDVTGVCEDYFSQYDNKTDPDDRSATISLVDCTKLDPLADVCAELFEKYRYQIGTLDYNSVQPYFRYSYHWFYDILDILIEAGASGNEISRMEDALNECVVYKAATPAFMPSYGGFNVDVFSGLSMYLPANGNRELDKFYKTLAWNIRTGLVQ